VAAGCLRPIRPFGQESLWYTFLSTITEHAQSNRGQTTIFSIKIRIFGPKKEEVTEGWGKLHNEELHNL
jgi:hypothetical protein